jgi:hypothetical protein
MQLHTYFISYLIIYCTVIKAFLGFIIKVMDSCVPTGREDEVPARQNTARLSAVIGTTTALSGLLPATNYSVQVHLKGH